MVTTVRFHPRSLVAVLLLSPVAAAIAAEPWTTPLRVRDVTYEFKVQAKSCETCDAASQEDVDVSWSYSVFIGGDRAETDRLNNWVRAHWSERLSECGDLSDQERTRLNDRQLIARVKATASTAGCETTRVMLNATHAFGPFVSFESHEAYGGVRPSAANTAVLLDQRTMATVATESLFQPEGLDALSEAIGRNVKKDHPDCNEGMAIDQMQFTPPARLYGDRNFDPRVWAVCSDGELLEGPLVRRWLRPEIRAMKVRPLEKVR
ncbi:hypothetical protein ACQ859_27060 [Roseateles chitinivorans]|uniref:hypothetical protein n=1 Tax=Roseateles chitinivorans TaxID=2917965 RepID=UPI003D66EA95